MYKSILAVSEGGPDAGMSFRLAARVASLFDGCVDASAYNALSFSAWVSGGDITGCNFKSQMQTFEQRPTSQNPPGACDSTAGSCYGFPAAAVTLGTTPTTFTLKFADLVGATHVNPMPKAATGWRRRRVTPKARMATNSARPGS